jgi:NADPH:quinone reductase-like Zn-dependent oxidoreductase
MAEKAVVPSSQCAIVPEGLDDITAAAIAIPGMSSKVALKERANFTVAETVLVNGATGTSGCLAVQVAKYLGAKKVIATGRHAATLRSIKAVGADETLLNENRDALENDFKEQFAGGVDVILDYLCGQSAESLLIAASRAGTDKPIRFIQIGTASGAIISLSGAILHCSTAIELKGSGLGSVPVNRIVTGIEGVLHAAVAGHFQMATKPVPLSEVERVWSSNTYMPRIVFTIGPPRR